MHVRPAELPSAAAWGARTLLTPAAMARETSTPCRPPTQSSPRRPRAGRLGLAAHRAFGLLVAAALLLLTLPVLLLAVLGGLGLALATAVLLVAGAGPGMPVGPNLAALSTFLPGYGITWTGALVGAAYGGAGGFVAGFLAATFWNFVHLVLLGVVTLRGLRF